MGCTGIVLVGEGDHVLNGGGESGHLEGRCDSRTYSNAACVHVLDAPSSHLSGHGDLGVTGDETGTIGAFLNRVLEITFLMLLMIVGMRVSRSASGMRSILFKTRITLSVVISPITMHSAVCAWMPFMQSITMRSMSMIWAPPRIVRIRLAWPGQSTSVY